MSPELKHLRYFIAVAEDLSFSVAARRLYVSQQALSKIIQQLEQQVGVKLFERTTRSVRPTPAGEAMLAPARQAIAAAEDAFNIARQAERGDHRRPLRIDISSSDIQTGAVLLHHYRRQYPQIPVVQVEAGVSRGLIALQKGHLDVLLGSASHCPTDIPSEVIRRERVTVGMTSDHPLSRLDAVPVARLADVDLLLPSDKEAIDWVEFVAQFCRQAGIHMRRWPGVTHGSRGAADVVRQGGCVVPTNQWVDPPDDLVFRPIIDPIPVFSWAMMIAPSAQSTPQVETFVTCTRWVAKLNGWLGYERENTFSLANAML